jgi:hypothetical protein
MHHSLITPWRIGLIGGVLALLVPSLATAEDAPAPGDDVGKLKADLAELKERVDDLTAAVDAKASNADSTLVIRGFGDIKFVGSSITPTTSPGQAPRYTADSFSEDAFDIFMNARLGQNITFLSETAFESNNSNQLGVDVERLLIKYDFGDDLNIQVGRFHTSIGYWNDTYHHGEWLNTAISKPFAVNFEDSGGIIPAHLVGISFAGLRNFGDFEVDWSFQFGNGRGPTSDPPEIYYGSQVPKATNFNLGVRPQAIPGLKIGVSAYFDHISPEEGTDPNYIAGTTPLHGGLHETIVNAYGVYKHGPIETFAEIYQFTHERTDNLYGNEEGMKDKDFAYYWQFGYKIGHWTPFFRYDVLQISQDNNYFPTYRDSARTYSVGVRWDVSSYNAIKLQFNHIRHSSYLPGPNTLPTNIENSLVSGNAIENTISVQTSFAF